ncbi:MAG: glycoside hydrolase family 3 C-terminal domain-containing protein [Clostridia bacterium]
MQQPYQDHRLSVIQRVEDLVSRMSLEEKISQMLHVSPAIPRLGIPAYTWWNEALHGVARAGTATVFPQAIAMAASFDVEMVFRSASVISDEARAKHHEYLRQKDTGIYKGLTMWSPNINIFRDPRWGRGHETFGEDPHLTGRMGCAFVKGMQGDDATYLKTIATPKHFAVHSGPEKERHTFDARVSEKDLRETYLPAFRDCVVEAGAASIMGAYNRTNGEPCCASRTLLQDILREEWGFKGFVVSDCHAICDIHLYHHTTEHPHESAALAVRNGCDLNCGKTYARLRTAVEEGLVNEKDIDTAVKRLFTARFKLGMFDPPGKNKYTSIPFESNDSPSHRELSLEMARKSLVLLKNDRILPLDKGIGSIAVIGPNADDRHVLLANYSGIPSRFVTVLEGIIRKVPDARINYSVGCDIARKEPREDEAGLISEAVSCALASDAVVLVTGLNTKIEGEQADPRYPEFGGGDREDITLPGRQEELILALAETGKPLILVNLSGSCVDLTKAHELCRGVIQAWYPGALGGLAVADLLFGDCNPCGKLPLTFYRSISQLPPFEEYGMTGRTYRYFTGEPLYPFGYGLSYSDFTCHGIGLDETRLSSEGILTAYAEVKNNGPRDGREILQLYVKTPLVTEQSPLYQLKDFKPVALKAGHSCRVSFEIDMRKLSFINSRGKRVLLPGTYGLFIGSGQPDARTKALTGKECLHITYTLPGTQAREMTY